MAVGNPDIIELGGLYDDLAYLGGDEDSPKPILPTLTDDMKKGIGIGVGLGLGLSYVLTIAFKKLRR